MRILSSKVLKNDKTPVAKRGPPAKVADLLSFWHIVQHPRRTLARRTWRDWFERVGFVSDGAPMPTEPVEVWRAQAGRSMGLSWTRDQDRAVWFHERNRERSWPRRLLHTFAPPGAILGLIDEGRGEREASAHSHLTIFSEVSSDV